MTETEIIDRIRNGENFLFKQLMESYQAKIFHLCLGFVHNTDDANDLTQEIFIKIYQNLASFQGKARLSTWIYRIAVNKCLSFVQSKKRQSILVKIESMFSFSKLKESRKTLKEHTNPETSLYNKEDAQILHRAIDSLPENQRIAFTLNKYDELSYQEISEVMNLSLSSVESLMHRAKLGLQNKLKDFYKKR